MKPFEVDDKYSLWPEKLNDCKKDQELMVCSSCKLIKYFAVTTYHYEQYNYSFGSKIPRVYSDIKLYYSPRCDVCSNKSYNKSRAKRLAERKQNILDQETYVNKALEDVAVKEKQELEESQKLWEEFQEKLKTNDVYQAAEAKRQKRLAKLKDKVKCVTPASGETE